MRLDLAQGGFAQVVHRCHWSVGDLHCVGQGAADGLGVGRGAVTAHDLYARIVTQPCFQRVAVRSGSTLIRSWISASITTVA